VPDYEANQWYGVGAPEATPAEVVEKFNKEINAAVRRSQAQGAAFGRRGATKNQAAISDKSTIASSFSRPVPVTAIANRFSPLV